MQSHSHSALCRCTICRDRLHAGAPRAWLGLEMLENRRLLSGLVLIESMDMSLVQSVIVAGDPNGSPTDSPALRVDPNTTTSPFAGVGSLEIRQGADFYICSATPISPTHLLTAGHCVDINNDGVPDIDALRFVLNFGSNGSHIIDAISWEVHPDFTGFANPSVNDDLTVITLSEPLPAGVPIYPLSSVPFSQDELITLVGYGQSGDGVNGYTVSPSFFVKRSGMNVAQGYDTDDEGGSAVERWEADFDGGSAQDLYTGGSLGNDIETTLGGGDSGGPSFLWNDDGDGIEEQGEFVIFGVNTYVSQLFPIFYPEPPLFGSLAGGVVVAPYVDWINSIIGGGNPTNQPPVAVSDSGATNEDSLLVVAAPGVLANDSDPDGDSLSAVPASLTSSMGAAVVVNADGSYSYNPTGSIALQSLPQGQQAVDSFSYTVHDGSGGNDTAAVNITVTGVNDAPVANDDSATIAKINKPITVNVLSNDSDVDAGTVLSVVIVSGPAHGSAVVNANGSISYTANNTFSGTDTLVYSVSDGLGGSDTATVTITKKGGGGGGPRPRGNSEAQNVAAQLASAVLIARGQPVAAHAAAAALDSFLNLAPLFSYESFDSDVDDTKPASVWARYLAANQ